jgi:ATP-binding cassette subfamily B (MDR/TAP) protein 1
MGDETEKDVGVVEDKRNNHDDEATTSEKKVAGTSTSTTTNGENEKDKTKEKQETVPFHKLFTFADSTDILLMIVGTIGAIGNGLGLPLMTLLFGEMIDSFGSNQSNTDDVVQQVSKVISRVNKS